MWSYEKRLQFPVRIKTPNAAAAKVIITQYGGPDGELGASMRYLSQRYTMPWRGVAGLLTDIGTEELAHLEMVSAIVYQLTKGLPADEIRRQGFDTYFGGPYGRRVAPGGGRYAVHVHVLRQQGRRHHGSARGHGSRWRDRKEQHVASPDLCVFACALARAAKI